MLSGVGDQAGLLSGLLRWCASEMGVVRREMGVLCMSGILERTRLDLEAGRLVTLCYSFGDRVNSLEYSLGYPYP